jgi:spermidine/putrescine transport system permease protein
MTTVTAQIPDRRPTGRTLARRGGRFGDLWDHVLVLAGVCGLAFLFAPFLVLIVFSFNDNAATVLPLSGFTLGWYEKAFANAEMMSAVLNSFYVGISAVVLCLLVGVPAAVALDRRAFPGKALFRRFALLPMTLPGIITGIALLNMFRAIGLDLSLLTVILGHGTALTAVVITLVFARLQRLNRTLEEVSGDLGARPWQTFLFVTLPNIRRTIIGASLLSFTLSFDEIPVTFFLIGRDDTLPMYIYSAIRRGVTPEVNAIGALVLVGSLIVILTAVYLLNKEE